MKRHAWILFKNQKAGLLTEETDHYLFSYNPDYLQTPGAQPISLTMPLRTQPYKDRQLHSFFDGLIPEGWLLDVATSNWKVKPRDRMGLLLVSCVDCIGAVSVEDCSVPN
jgi:serine/threonine-protein kinase HipA